MVGIDFYRRKELAIRWINDILEEAWRADRSLSIAKILYDMPPEYSMKSTIMQRIEGSIAIGRFLKDDDILIPVRGGRRRPLMKEEQEILDRAITPEKVENEEIGNESKG
jgi:hypothetical protein